MSANRLFHVLMIGTLLLTGCVGDGSSGGSSDSATSQTESTGSDTETDSQTDTTVVPDTTLWMLNTEGERSGTIFEENTNQGVLVNVQSVEAVTRDGKNYVEVQSSGIPSYRVEVTQELLDSLDERPNAATDFASGMPDLAVGEEVAFGQDIGYLSTTRGNCMTTGGYGYWPPGPDCPQDIAKVGDFPVEPSDNDTVCDTGLGPVGYFLNGTSIYNWDDGQSYNNEDTWHNTAANAEVHDLDICSGHAAQSDYHHHNWSHCLADQLDDEGNGHSPIYGFAADGYPVYGPWFADGELARSAWVARDYSDPDSASGCGEANARTCLLVDPYDLTQGTMPAANAGPASNGTITSMSGNPIAAESGLYFEDYYYDPSLTAQGGAYLDEHNGHAHDGLGYHYHLSMARNDAGELVPAFPFTVGPTFKGELDDNTVTQCGGQVPGGAGGMFPPPGL
ncbi:YHYH protein [Marinobacteraceae bacterium S3BR75-40.1]